MNPCESKVCLNGICKRINSTGYKCECSSGWSGFKCEIDIKECEVNPCLNGGLCREMEPPHFQCQCSSGILYFLYQLYQNFKQV